MTGELNAVSQTEEVLKPPPPPPAVVLPKMLTDFDIVDRLDSKQTETVIIYFILLFTFSFECRILLREFEQVWSMCSKRIWVCFLARLPRLS